MSGSNTPMGYDAAPTSRIPSLSRLPEELGRENRFCERCGAAYEHILYMVPKKVALVLYSRNHPENVHATCTGCAKSTILTGEERARALSKPTSLNA